MNENPPSSATTSGFRYVSVDEQRQEFLNRVQWHIDQYTNKLRSFQEDGKSLARDDPRLAYAEYMAYALKEHISYLSLISLAIAHLSDALIVENLIFNIQLNFPDPSLYNFIDRNYVSPAYFKLYKWVHSTKLLVGGVGGAHLPDEVEDRSSSWKNALKAEGVPEDRIESLVAEFRAKAAQVARPKWADRLDHKDLRTLTAPQFLKKVHAAEIASDGSVVTQAIRAIDPELMKAVDTYISQRKSRDAHLGDAADLKFVTTRTLKAARRDKAPS